jgi:polysaccharide biosynthesis transport protein
MNLYLFLSALRARFGLFFWVLAGTVLAGIVLSLVLPKVYTATASLVVDFRNEQSLNNTLNPLLVSPRENIGYMQTQMDIIMSDKVARKVVDMLKLAENPVFREDYESAATQQGTIEDWLVESLQEYLKVDTSQSSVIHISFSSRSPVFSAQVANAFAHAYIDTMLGLRVNPTREAATWFDDQLRTLRTNLTAAQTRLTEYQKRHGIASGEERSDIESTRLEQLSTQLARAQDLTFEWEAKRQQARRFLDTDTLPDSLPEVLADPFIQRLKTDLAAGEARLHELGAQYGPNYPLYQQRQDDNRALREKLHAEMKKVVASIESSARQSRQREEDLRKEMEAQRSRLLDMRGSRNDLVALQRDVTSAQTAYDTALQRSTASQVDSRANQTNVSVLNEAVAPRKPTRPKMALNIALSIVVGTMLGLAMVVLMEMFDRRIRSRNDLDFAEYNVPLLAVLNVWGPAKHPMLVRADGTRRALPSPR